MLPELVLESRKAPCPENCARLEAPTGHPGSGRQPCPRSIASSDAIAGIEERDDLVGPLLRVMPTERDQLIRETTVEQDE